jgi:cell division protein FtsL
MDTYVIIAVIVASVLATAAIALVILLLYYHWRNRELLTNFSAFIRENLKLKDEIGRLQEENSELNEELNKTK